MSKPDLSTVPAWYHNYINLVLEEDAKSAIKKNSDIAIAFLQSIPEEKWDYRYAEGKWSIKELVQHLIDTERIFAYRALTFARGDKTGLPGFEENEYAAASKAGRRTKESLIDELKVVRLATEMLFHSFDEEQLKLMGTANNNPISVNTIGFIIPGHLKHHINVLKERYL
ncbi:MAG: DinB family protein [Bacteroidota bacterium]|nr:DinB family protein [Bacteroidota bacterium]